MKEKLIPIAPEEFRTMKPPKVVFTNTGKEVFFLGLTKGKQIWFWDPEEKDKYYSSRFSGWHRRPEPEPVIEFEGKAQKREGIRSASVTGNTFDTSNYQLNDWNQELEEGKKYTVKVYESNSGLGGGK